MKGPDAPPPARILVVEDQGELRNVLVSVLGAEGYRATGVESGEAGLAALDREMFDVVLLDVNLPGISGMQVLSAGRALQTDAQFVMMTGFGSVEAAVEAMQIGAFHYLNKPVQVPELLLVVERAIRDTETRRELAQLRRQAGGVSRIVGRSPALLRTLDLVARVAPTRAAVLVTGETGTGKELIARSVHDLSSRARKPFVAVNCSAIPESLLESELFGHVKGAFTGAVSGRRGLFEEAAGGTLFLDEIATIPPATQVKLLRVLQERKVQRLGGGPPTAVDFRLVAACNVDLAAEVEAGRFREDLFYRLNVFPVHVPPLRERKSDIPLLAHHFRERFAAENGMQAPEITPATLERMMGYEWPGNIRELESFMERALILHAGSRTVAFELPRTRADGGASGLLAAAEEGGWSLERLEREYILAVLEKTGGHQGDASAILEIDPRTLGRKLKRYRHGAAEPA